MASDVKYIQIPVEARVHRQFRLISIRRGCTLKRIVVEALLFYLKNAPEANTGKGDKI